MSDEVVLDYTSPDGPRATHVRSTLISSSLETLRSLGLYDALASALPAAHRESILLNFAPTWVPIEVACVYYATWEALPMTAAQEEQLGPRVGGRLMASLLATVARGARSAGASPWLPLKQFDRLWSRVVRGGAVRIVQRGPKEVVIEARGLPMLNGPRFQESYRGLVLAAGATVARTVYARPLALRERDAYALLGSWV